VNKLAAFVLATLALTASAQGDKGQLAQANAALQAGEADKAMALLNPLAQAGSAPAYNLRCRVQFILEHWDRAASDCQQAVKLDGQNSVYHMWLGRALGERADRASFMSAYSLGKQVRVEFEEAVRLDPRNAEALADLGEFYYSAPGVVGGGTSKAQGIATRLDKVDPTRAHELRARIAEHDKDYGTAEREYKQAITVDPHPAFHWMTLASFYRHRERWTDMDSAIRSGESAAARDKHAGPALYNGAAILRATHRDPAHAATMLENYLAGTQKTEEAPAFVAHMWLAGLKEQLGDPAAARREQAASLALAYDYKPAQDRKH
jgi:tetratricopeptide (TPR) repeat protein